MQLPATCSTDVLSMYSGTLPKLSSKSSPNIMLEQKTASFIARATFQRAALGRHMASLKMFGIRSDSPPPKMLGCVLVVVYATSAATTSASS